MPTFSLRIAVTVALLVAVTLSACDEQPASTPPPDTNAPTAWQPQAATESTLRELGVAEQSPTETVLGRVPLWALVQARTDTSIEANWEEAELILQTMNQAFTEYYHAHGAYNAPNAAGLQAVPGTSANHFAPVIGLDLHADAWVSVSPSDFYLSALTEDHFLIVVSPATDGRNAWSSETRRIDETGNLQRPQRDDGIDISRVLAQLVTAVETREPRFASPFFGLMELAVELTINGIMTDDYRALNGSEATLSPGPAGQWLSLLAPRALPGLEAEAQDYSLNDFRLLSIDTVSFLLAFSPEFDGREVWSANWMAIDHVGDLRLIERTAGQLPEPVNPRERTAEERWEPALRMLRGVLTAWAYYADTFGGFDAEGPAGVPRVGDRLDRLAPLLDLDISALLRIDDFSAASFAVVALGPETVRIAAVAPFGDQALVIDENGSFSTMPVADIPPQRDPQARPLEEDPTDE